ncbi:hypothetical protein J6590_031267 [Homalodisca vitripennis]|nr:hypothetical protein J6590_031267 [Homalodisca vitripennis]
MKKVMPGGETTLSRETEVAERRASKRHRCYLCPRSKDQKHPTQCSNCLKGLIGAGKMPVSSRSLCVPPLPVTTVARPGTHSPSYREAGIDKNM